jgi:hypothetical protein
MPVRKTATYKPKLTPNPLMPSQGPPPGATALPPYSPPMVSRTVTAKAAGTKTRGKKK